MKVIVGLGNPGDTYKDSRHNVGLSLVKALAKSRAATLKRDSLTHSMSGRVRLAGCNALLATPLTYMNLSGRAVKALLKKYAAQPSDLLVVVDDLDLELGRLKIKAQGSSGGHKGLESIAESLRTREFARLRLGIGRPGRGMDSAEYVLQPFLKKEKETLGPVMDQAMECCARWAREGINKAMSKFNYRDLKPGDVSLALKGKRPHENGDKDEQV